MEFRNKIILGDTLDIMRKLPEGAFDIVITSPPYNINGDNHKSGLNSSHKWKSNKLKDGYNQHGDNMPREEYVAWQRACVAEMLRLIPDTGAIYYNHKPLIRKGLLLDPMDILRDFPVRQQIVWARAGGINFNRTYYLPSHEMIYLIAKKDFKLTEVGNRCGTVWRINQAMKNPHPAPFPLELPSKIIDTTGAQSVLDPFIGSGTTAIAALINSISYTGIDNSPAYIEMTQNRIEAVRKQPSLF